MAIIDIYKCTLLLVTNLDTHFSLNKYYKLFKTLYEFVCISVSLFVTAWGRELMIIIMKIIGIPTVFDGSQLLEDYHWHFNLYPMILSVYAIDYFFNFENKCTRTHASTHTHTHTHACTRTWAGDNLQYNILSELNILNCADDFLKCVFCLPYPTIILELKSKTFFGTHGHKEQFYFSKVCSD